MRRKEMRLAEVDKETSRAGTGGKESEEVIGGAETGRNAGNVETETGADQIKEGIE